MTAPDQEQTDVADYSAAAGSQSAVASTSSQAGRAGRIAGLAILVVAIVTAILASGFRVGFLTDPIGPRALPWLASLLLAVGGAMMIARPGSPPASIAAPMRAKVSLAIGAFVMYAIVLPLAGFVLSTAFLMALLARFYGGRWVQGIAAGVIFGGSLWLLFARALGVPLPLGAIFSWGG
jgi:putative tricarboxylic transport membrane protein